MEFGAGAYYCSESLRRTRSGYWEGRRFSTQIIRNTLRVFPCLFVMDIVVLSVEDDPATFYVLQLAFRECGFPVSLYRASDGEEALTMLQQAGRPARMPRPHLILLNVNLPRKSGLEVLAALRADPALASVPAVVFTSSSLDSERAKCLALGAVDYLTKPSDFDGVLQAVQSVCARAASAH